MEAILFTTKYCGKQSGHGGRVGVDIWYSIYLSKEMKKDKLSENWMQWMDLLWRWKDSLLNQHNEKSLLAKWKVWFGVRIVCKWVLLLLSSWPNVCLLIELCMKCGRYWLTRNFYETHPAPCDNIKFFCWANKLPGHQNTQVFSGNC